MIEKTGNMTGLEQASFWPDCSWEMTAPEFDSLPEPGTVRTVAILSDVSAILFPRKKSRKSPSQGTPIPIAFAESMTLPPPTAKMKSRSFLLQSSIPR
jgi:hypothetical protein